MRAETVDMGTYVVVVSDTYEQALRHLFETWTPESGREPAQIVPQRQAIGGGPWQA